MYWENQQGKSVSSLDNYRTVASGPSTTQTKFFELEPAVVLDIILDENHPYLKSNNIKIVPSEFPPDFSGSPASPDDKDYSWIGRVLVRLVHSSKGIEKEELVWAIPLENGISEFPLVNELVIVSNYFNRYFYSKKLNVYNFPCANLDFSKEQVLGGFKSEDGAQLGNRELYQKDTPYKGPKSIMSINNRLDKQGVAGRYFWFNKNIRSLKRREGDTIIESRFGQSIRFAAYDDDRKKDVGLLENKDYVGDGSTNPYSGELVGGGNPMILIRNRQRPLLPKGEKKSFYGNVDPVIGTESEKNSGGYLLEDINNDGSSIHITSGLTRSMFKTSCFKSIFQSSTEEVPSFSPPGASSFVFPKDLLGDQVVINSDRLIFQSRRGETFLYSKKRFGIVTDSEYSLDSHDQIVMTSHNKVVFNSPAIYLGEYNNTDEPVLLGQSTVNWLYDLCELLKKHTHWHNHGHVKKSAGRAVPNKTQAPVEAAQFEQLQSVLNKLMSRRVFVVGGGFSPGKDGAQIKNGSKPTSIIVSSGEGLPGGWKGKNKR